MRVVRDSGRGVGNLWEVVLLPGGQSGLLLDCGAGRRRGSRTTGHQIRGGGAWRLGGWPVRNEGTVHLWGRWRCDGRGVASWYRGRGTRVLEAVQVVAWEARALRRAEQGP